MRGLHRGNRVPEGTAIGNAAMAFLFFFLSPGEYALRRVLRHSGRLSSDMACSHRRMRFDVVRAKYGPLRASCATGAHRGSVMPRGFPAQERRRRAWMPPERTESRHRTRKSPTGGIMPVGPQMALKREIRRFGAYRPNRRQKKKKHRGMSHGACIMVLHPSPGYGRFE